LAHPYASSRQSKVEHSRAGTLTKGYATGGAVHGDEAQDRKLVKSMLREHERSEGEGRARGGRAPKGTNVNVIMSPSNGQAVPPPPMPMAGPVAAPPMPPPRPPMAPPPGAGMVPPGGPPMPPGGPIRSTGGRTGYKSGGAVPGPAWNEGRRNGTQVTHAPGKNDLKDMNRPPVITKATGGAVEHPMKGGRAPHLPGGAGGGLARIAKQHRGKVGGKAI